MLMSKGLLIGEFVGNEGMGYSYLWYSDFAFHEITPDHRMGDI